jgi:hypothetical protein
LRPQTTCASVACPLLRAIESLSIPNLQRNVESGKYSIRGLDGQHSQRMLRQPGSCHLPFRRPAPTIGPWISRL